MSHHRSAPSLCKVLLAVVQCTVVSCYHITIELDPYLSPNERWQPLIFLRVIAGLQLR